MHSRIGARQRGNILVEKRCDRAESKSKACGYDVSAAPFVSSLDGDGEHYLRIENGAPKKTMMAAGEEMLQKIELPGYTRRYPFELSGGQQQRVALPRPDHEAPDPFAGRALRQFRPGVEEFYSKLGQEVVEEGGSGSYFCNP